MKQIEKDARKYSGDPDRSSGGVEVNQSIPMRNGLMLNRAYVDQYPHEQRLRIWKDEYIEARRVMRCKGARATREENDRMCYAAMMWTWERDCGGGLPASDSRELN